MLNHFNWDSVKLMDRCWKDYLTIKIMGEGACQSIQCQDTNCNILVDEDIVLKIISDEKIRLKYNRLMTNAYVECNKQIKWCPGK